MPDSQPKVSAAVTAVRGASSVALTDHAVLWAARIDVPAAEHGIAAGVPVQSAEQVELEL